jgi:hypothetical protein
MSDASLTRDNLDPPAGPPQTSKVRVPAARSGKEVGGKLKKALDLMVWEGVPWADAAKAVAYDGKWMRKALERPHVMRYIREQKQVFRTYASARNIHRAAEIRDQDDNKTAAIQAIRYLDGLGDSDVRSDGQRVQPGVVVQINVERAGREADETVIEVHETTVPDSASGDETG